MNDIVSVVIPTYNRAGLLKRALQSVREQTLQDLEILVSDDGSTDGTEDVVADLQRQDDRISYLPGRHSGGAAVPKNRALSEARGKYVATLDSDDEWYSDKLERQVALLEETPELGFVGCHYIEVSDGREVPVKVPSYEHPLEKVMEVDYLGPGSCMLYREDVFNEVGGFDENLRSGQDKEMRLRLLTAGYGLGIVPEVLVEYHKEEDGISTNHLSPEEREEDWKYVFLKYKEHYEKRPKIWSGKLRYDGTRYMLYDRPGKARRSLIESIQKDALNWRSYAYLFLSFLGSGIYKHLTQWKQAAGK